MPSKKRKVKTIEVGFEGMKQEMINGSSTGVKLMVRDEGRGVVDFLPCDALGW